MVVDITSGLATTNRYGPLPAILRGLFLYVAAMNDDAIAIFSRDSGVGDLTFVTRVKNGEGVVEGLNGARSLVVSRDGARSIAISPDGMNLSVAGWVDDALADSRPANSAD